MHVCHDFNLNGSSHSKHREEANGKTSPACFQYICITRMTPKLVFRDTHLIHYAKRNYYKGKRNTQSVHISYTSLQA